MEVTQQGRRSKPAGKGRFTEALVLVSMALLTIALGTAAHLHGGLDVWTSITSSLAIFVCLLALHGLVRSRKAVDAMRSKISRLETEVERLGGDAGRESRGSRSKFTAKPAGPPPPFNRQSEYLAGAWPDLGPTRAPSRTAEPVEKAPRGSGRHQTPMAPPPLSADLAKPPPVRTSTQPGAEAGLKAKGRSEAPAATPAMRVRQGDVEMLQAMIKKLADEVNAAEAAGSASPEFGKQERAVGRSIDALKTTAASMRAADRPSRDGGGSRRRASTDKASPGPEAKTQAIKDALVAGRVDVLLEPILTLKDRKPRHFEISLRLTDESGEVLDLHGSQRTERSILPIIDRVNVERTAQIALRLECRGRQGALFSSISGESLGSDKFLDGVANAYQARESFAGQLVMTFSQADVRRFGERERATLAEFADQGFRFAIGSVTDLDMDFAALKERGFDFVKLDADVFLLGLMTGETRVPARDICRYLANLGMTLIVGRIDDEHVAARVFGFGVLFGQGQMFGGPRPVKRSTFDTGKDHLAA